MVSCGSSSERADSLAADDAFDAAVDSQIQNAHNAAADAAAVVVVRGRLTACGVIGPSMLPVMLLWWLQRTLLFNVAPSPLTQSGGTKPGGTPHPCGI